MELRFEWDEAKARINLRKHGVRFEEAKTVFNDPFSVTMTDDEHSGDEERWVDIGQTPSRQLLVVWYTERDEVIRIIGARRANRAERRTYEDEPDS